MSVSFLIPAHNEERLIRHALDNLARLRESFPNLQVIVGLDGCTDNTEAIVREFPFVDCVTYRERQGKHVVMAKLVSLAKHEIVCVHDADWAFGCTPDEFKKLLACFSDPDCGGLGDWYSTTYTAQRVRENNNTLFLGDAWNTLFLTEFRYQRSVQKGSFGKDLVVQNPAYPFFVNFFRKNAMGAQAQQTLADDAERLYQLQANGFYVQTFAPETRPYFKVIWERIGWRDYYRQRLRGFLAKRQVNQLYGQYKASLGGFYLPLFAYGLAQLPRVGRPKAVLGFFLWWLLAGLALVGSKFKSAETKSGWQMRYAR